jgi:hypothetical protein
MRSMELAVSSALLAILCSTQVYAQGCDSILQHGIWEEHAAAGNLRQVRSYLHWACSKELSSYNSDTEAAASLGIPVEGLPLEFGGDYKRSEWKDYSKEMCRYTKDGFAHEQEFTESSKRASEAIANAWSNCINADLFRAWIQYSEDPTIFSVEMRNRSANGNNVLTIQEPDGWVVTSKKPVTCAPDLANRGRTIKNGSLTVTCTRDPHDTVTVTINSLPAKSPQGALTVKAMPVPAAPPPRQSIAERIGQGGLFFVFFDSARFVDTRCDVDNWRKTKMGNLKALSAYIVQYHPVSKEWTTTGPNQGKAACGQSTSKYAGPAPSEYKLNLWGRVFDFNDKGEVFDNNDDAYVGDPNKRLVGHITF